MQKSIDSENKLREAFQEAGYECASVGGSRDYDGSPFSTGRDGDDCYYFTPGSTKKSSCTGNNYGHRSPLCSCGSGSNSLLDDGNGKFALGSSAIGSSNGATNSGEFLSASSR